MSLSKRMPLTIRLAIFLVVAGLAWRYNHQQTQQQENTSLEAPTIEGASLDPVERRETVIKAAPPVAQQTPVISANLVNRLKSLDGQLVTVTGTLQKVNQAGSGHYFLNFQGTTFKAICFSDDAAAFKGAPGAGLEGREVALTGKVEIYKDDPQIKLTDPAQLKAWDPHAIDATAGALEKVGRDHWVSPAGLHYKGTDSEGLTRVEHMLRHTKDIPGRDGSHGVFDTQGDAVFALIDQAWEKAQQVGMRPEAEGPTSTLKISMGRRVGFLGGQSGARKNHPALTKVFIVFRTGTREIITAYPRS